MTKGTSRGIFRKENMDQKTYEINGKNYSQGPIVPGQLKQLYGIIEGLKGIDLSGMTDVPALVALLGDRLPGFAAVLLKPEGVRLKDKDVTALTDEFEDNLSLDTALEIIADFFTFNPIPLIVERLRALTVMIPKPLQAVQEAPPTA